MIFLKDGCVMLKGLNFLLKQVNANIMVIQKNITSFSYLLFSLLFVSCTTGKQISNSTTSFSQLSTASTKPEVQSPVKFKFSSLVKDPLLANAHVGICIFEPSSNQYLYTYQSDKYFIPASNVKIATCYAAMKYLADSIVGLKYRETDDEIIIQGNADPTFLHKDFNSEKALQWLKKSNKKITVSDAKFFEKQLGKGWSWDDYQETYMAERSAMPMYGNIVKFYFEGDVYKTIPHYFEKFFSSQFQASDGNMKFNVSRAYGNNSFFFDINPGKKDSDEITFNTSQTINPISNLLEDTLGKTVGKVAYKICNEKLYSQKTDSVLKYMMYNSDNFFAEELLLMLSNERLSLMNDDKFIDTLLKTDFAHLPQNPRWVDGSGLSRYNLFSPNDFVVILNKIKDEFGMDRIKTIFPLGNNGTLNGYYKGVEKNIYAKTGSLSNNTALSGFIIAKSGKELIFSILINNFQGNSKDIKKAIEVYLSSIINYN